MKLKTLTMAKVIESLDDENTQLTTITRDVTITQGETTITVPVLSVNNWKRFIAEHASWKFVSLVADIIDEPSPQNSWFYFSFAFTEFWTRKEKGITDAIKAFYKEYDLGASYGEDVTVTTEYGKSVTNNGASKGVSDQKNGAAASITGVPANNGLSLGTTTGTPVTNTAATVTYDADTLKDVQKTTQAGSTASQNGSQVWSKEENDGEDTVTTHKSGFNTDIAEKIRTEIAFRIQQDITKQVLDQFAKETLFLC